MALSDLALLLFSAWRRHEPGSGPERLLLTLGQRLTFKLKLLEGSASSAWSPRTRFPACPSSRSRAGQRQHLVYLRGIRVSTEAASASAIATLRLTLPWVVRR